MKLKLWIQKYNSLHRAHQGEINYNFFDIYTIAHFFIGAFYGAIELSIFTCFVLAVVWEIIENFLKTFLPILFPHATADTWKNSLVDIIAVLTGYWLITYLMKVLMN